MSYDNAIVITTAPSERQVREILWRELRRLYMPVRDIIGGKLTRTRLEFSPKRYAYGFSTNTEDRFQGFHSGNILVIVDEASGVDEFIYNAIDLASPLRRNSKLVAYRQPARIRRHVLQRFPQETASNSRPFTSQRSIYPLSKTKASPRNNIKDVEYPEFDDDPNEFDEDLRTNPDHKLRFIGSVIASMGAIRVYSTRHGPQSSIYQTRVLGQFPEEADDTLIPLRDVEAAVKRQAQVPPDSQTQLWASMSLGSVTTKP